MFRILESREGGFVKLKVEGELDLATAADLHRRVETLREQGADVELDLSELEFMDSSGVRVLLALSHQSRRNGWRFRIARKLSSPVRRYLELAYLESFLFKD